ncbi:peptide-methionine (S)-S-oxide reductase MsrA [Acinetobacter qingfengensis]|uniref:Peptide methionine sulfoxide reductase MsrA n=1 Tax=Acinetobacter qingfengensis TaxID=1262585 RepID=A0A1E7REA1_9GAMM|nr:peptide-methionine (S)-S-oxide reductase MsrA [Acinetobacter qingfengensis]KAA8734520.1 peptide-methionine (S)-S-oxide reductase MsrA [Acinetobacter qingfengensis]OEY97557.1 peptide-methionine (S)-S-oxide reductase [Acinetobacter qingfengensis]
MQQAIFGGGCFWCTESVFQHVKGVQHVESGYAGGQFKNPNYEQVCSGETGHAEVIKIEFDETQISFTQLLDVFFATHDPTTLNRQGNDTGTQYRSVIFYLNDAQKVATHTKILDLKQQGINVVTELAAVPVFYSAEEYHQNFYQRNPSQGYCNFAIPPKLEKLQQKFPELFTK